MKQLMFDIGLMLVVTFMVCGVANLIEYYTGYVDEYIKGYIVGAIFFSIKYERKKA